MSLIEKTKISLALGALGAIGLMMLMLLSPRGDKGYDDMGLRRDVCMLMKASEANKVPIDTVLHIEEANEKKLYVVASVLGQEIGFIRAERLETLKLIESGMLEIKACNELGIVVE